MKYSIFLILILLFACNKKSKYADRIASNDIIKLKSVSGDWLIDHKEKHISFDEYSRKYNPIKNNSTDTILLYLINNDSNKNSNIFSKCEEYLSIFFQRKVLLSTNNKLIPDVGNSRIGYDNDFQLNAKFIIDSLLTKPFFKNYIATMALTSNDIYPGNDWNFVFGLANYANRVGVTSTYRFDSDNSNLKLLRLLKTASHEISHMFGLTHCVSFECLMNGSNHLQELDRNQLRLCSICQNKLIYRLEIEPEKRLESMLAFLNRNNLKEDFNYITLDK